jgi:23S rRNA (cytosine1962-C5)-methyltransferase
MFSADQYELLDFGGGRKLERFGQYVLDRPAPAAETARRASQRLWARATARFERTGPAQGRWLSSRPLPRSWVIRHESSEFELRPSPFGHVGIFPEQAENWDWIADRVGSADRPLQVLNLFAYTGGATLAAAARGAAVVHVDAARNSAQWARRNAGLSGLGGASIRWIVEDATKFVRRERQRGNRYDAVILDPPSYGHGPQGEPWKIAEDLLPLFALCGELVHGQPAFALLTCHSPVWGLAELKKAMVETGLCPASRGVVARAIELCSRDGRRLPSGVVVRWPE